MFSTTYYCSNPRKAAFFGSYVYHKTVNNADFVRIECRYKRPFFRKMKITRMEDAGSINPQVILSKLDFKLFNVKRFLEKLLRLQALSEGDESQKLSPLKGISLRTLINGEAVAFFLCLLYCSK